MDPTDLTLEILRAIRDEARKTNERLESLEDRFEAMAQRQTEAEVRLSTEVMAVAEAVREVSDLLREQMGSRLRDHERRIAALENRAET